MCKTTFKYKHTPNLKTHRKKLKKKLCIQNEIRICNFDFFRRAGRNPLKIIPHTPPPYGVCFDTSWGEIEGGVWVGQVRFLDFQEEGLIFVKKIFHEDKTILQCQLNSQ